MEKKEKTQKKITAFVLPYQQFKQLWFKRCFHAFKPHTEIEEIAYFTNAGECTRLTKISVTDEINKQFKASEHLLRARLSIESLDESEKKEDASKLFPIEDLCSALFFLERFLPSLYFS